MVKPIPEGFHTLTPYLVQRDAAAAIAFYKKAFGARVVSCMKGHGGAVMHAELRIGNSMLMMGSESPEMGTKSPAALRGTPVEIFQYVKDVDAVFRKAVAGGAKPLMPVSDMFWGDRYGKFVDPFGHVWSVATHREDMTDVQIAERAKKFHAGNA